MACLKLHLFCIALRGRQTGLAILPLGHAQEGVRVRVGGVLPIGAGDEGLHAFGAFEQRAAPAHVQLAEHVVQKQRGRLAISFSIRRISPSFMLSTAVRICP